MMADQEAIDGILSHMQKVQALERIQEVRSHWNKAGMSEVAFDHHLRSYRQDIETESYPYYNYSLDYYVQISIIARYKSSAYYDKSRDETTSLISKITFPNFCSQVGIRREAAEKWQTKFKERNMEVSPQIYIFAALHGVSTNCDRHGWKCDLPTCPSFKFAKYSLGKNDYFLPDEENIERLDPEDFIIYGKWHFIRCELFDHNTDYNSLIQILGDPNISLECCIEFTKQHIKANPKLNNVYCLLTEGNCGGLQGRRYGVLPLTNREKALKLVRFMERREPLVYDDSGFQLTGPVEGIVFPISAISLAPDD